jgi:hypothetical protein
MCPDQQGTPRECRPRSPESGGAINDKPCDSKKGNGGTHPLAQLVDALVALLSRDIEVQNHVRRGQEGQHLLPQRQVEVVAFPGKILVEEVLLRKHDVAEDLITRTSDENGVTGTEGSQAATTNRTV